MFQNCTELTSMSTNLLPADSIYDHCYQDIFGGYTVLKVSQNGPGTLIFKCPSWESAEGGTTDMLAGTGGTLQGHQNKWY